MSPDGFVLTPFFGPLGRVMLVRVLPEQWGADLRDAARRLLLLRRQDHVNASELLALEHAVQDWLRSGLTELERDARIYFLLDSGLRELDLAVLTPGAFDPPRIDLAITGIYAEHFVPEQLERVSARRPLVPGDVSILVATINDVESAYDERCLEVALQMAAQTGVYVVKTTDAKLARSFVWVAERVGLTHVLIAHSPGAGLISIGDEMVRLSNSARYVESDAPVPVELDLSICGANDFAAPLDHTHILSTRGHIWVRDVANIQYELWTGHWRRRFGGGSYWSSGFCYGEALVQARALHRHFAICGEDPVDDAVAALTEITHGES